MRRVILSLLFLAIMASQSLGADALESLNAKRKKNGLYALKPDATLQKWAEHKAEVQAKRHQMGHLVRGSYPGRGEGVGMVSGKDPKGSRLRACMMYTRRFKHAGAAAVVGNNGRTYYCVIYK